MYESKSDFSDRSLYTAPDLLTGVNPLAAKSREAFTADS